jgi:sigma-B regulation protein RsbU (phosphoserine phosphatase)
MPVKIMVVDDEPDLEQLVLQKFRKKIRAKEYEFVFAQNGVQALDALQQDGSIELVLTDINMPEMDGLTLLREMGSLNNRLLRSVIVSAYGDMENIRTAMNLGAYDFVTKPIDLADLEITVEKSLKDLALLKEALAGKEQLVSIRQELDIATSIQTGILPRTFPAFPDRQEFDIYAQMITAKEVGGDLYDFFLIDKYRLGLIIGDVSGKGVAAAMLMAVSKTLLQASAMKGVPTDTSLSEVNKVLVNNSPSNMFVTVFYGILDTRSGAFEYCNGGHNPPYLLSKDGKVMQVENIGGLFLGALKDVEYESNVTMLQPGETIFFYTDGVTEAEDMNEDEFAEKRLEACLSKNQKSGLKEIIENVIDEVQTFSEGMHQVDDITCLAVRYLGRS